MELLSNPKRTLQLALRFVGVILLLYLVWSLDMQKLGKVLAGVNGFLLIIAALSVLITISLKSARWNLFLENLGEKLDSRVAFGIVLGSVFWASVTPGRIGELYRFKPFLGDSDRLLKALASVIADRVFDVILLVLWTGFGLFVFWDVIPERQLLAYMLAGILTLVIIVVGLIISQKIHLSMPTLLVKLLPQSLIPSGNVGFGRFRNYLKEVVRTRKLLALTMSLLAMGISFVGVYWVAIGMGVHVSFLYLSTCYTIAALVSLVPISFGGLGTREAVFVLVLGVANISPEYALSLSFTVTVLYNIVLPAFFSLIFPLILRSGNRTPVESDNHQ